MALNVLAPSPTASTSSATPAIYPRPEPSVLIGIFPAAVVHVRPGDGQDDGSLTAAHEKALRLAEDRAKNIPNGWVGEMEAVKEEDEEGLSPEQRLMRGERTVVDIPPATKRAGLASGGVTRPNRPKSLILEAKGMGSWEEDKEQPPLPKLTAGDSTIAGEQYPLVDEIACAIREWYGVSQFARVVRVSLMMPQRLPTYLANREYRLFSTVMQHIDALFLGRRQLLSQTLSADELIRVRRESVSRLVKCNVAQGLEVIVRSLEDGSVMVVDRERAYSGATWIGGIACYVYQVQVGACLPLRGILRWTSWHTSISSPSTRFSEKSSISSPPLARSTPHILPDRFHS